MQLQVHHVGGIRLGVRRNERPRGRVEDELTGRDGRGFLGGVRCLQVAGEALAKRHDRFLDISPVLSTKKKRHFQTPCLAIPLLRVGSSSLGERRRVFLNDH